MEGIILREDFLFSFAFFKQIVGNNADQRTNLHRLSFLFSFSLCSVMWKSYRDEMLINRNTFGQSSYTQC